jgi:hypothetical protein
MYNLFADKELSELLLPNNTEYIAKPEIEMGMGCYLLDLTALTKKRKNHS